jgi:glycosyltransferase involved in cell wall biosynthesis
MKILQINSVCGEGSTGRMVTDLHAILLARGHQSTVAYGRNSATNCSQAFRIGNNTDNYLHAVITRIFDAHGFGSKVPTYKLIEKIQKYNPDLIHLHNLHGYYIHIGLLFEYLKRAGKPVVWTLHDCWALTGHCSCFDLIGCDRWQLKCYACPLKRNYPKSILFDCSTRNYRQKKELFSGVQKLTIATPSEWLERIVKQSFLGKYPILHIHNGIDLNMFRPTPSDFRSRYNLEDKFILLGVANIWNEGKGYSYFIELVKYLQADEKIVLVGLSKLQIRKLPKGILGIPKTNSIKELAEIYSAADLFVNPTMEEVLGMVNLEAMACNTPVITFNSGGSPECVDDGCGLVVERGDLRGLLSAIALVRKNTKNHYSKNCRKRVQKRFNKDARFAEYVKLYENCLRRQKMKL